MDKKLRIDELVEKLNAASNAYYGAGEEVISNYEWDAMFDELASLETETGYIRDDSPRRRSVLRMRSSKEGRKNGTSSPHCLFRKVRRSRIS